MLGAAGKTRKLATQGITSTLPHLLPLSPTISAATPAGNRRA
jgi:hypothetical protein